jgi:hypothetical protein
VIDSLTGFLFDTTLISGEDKKLQELWSSFDTVFGAMLINKK